MSQPTPYTPTTDFSQNEANNVGGRSTVKTVNLDAEFANIETTLDQTLANLALIQRDDGKLADDAIKNFIRAPIGETVSVLPSATNRMGKFLAFDTSGNPYMAAGATDASAGATATQLTEWALTQAFRLVSATRNSDEAITTATIAWPDGATGVFTGTVLSAAFPGAIDAWTATYVGTTTKTITQPTVTRDSSGAVTVQPAITIV